MCFSGAVNSRQIFKKFSPNYMKIRPVGAELFRADGRTDMHDEAKSLLAILCTRPHCWQLNDVSCLHNSPASGPWPTLGPVQCRLSSRLVASASNAILPFISPSLQYFFLVICSLLRYYAANSSNTLPTFRDNLSVPVRRAKNFLTLVSYLRCLKDANCIIL